MKVNASTEEFQHLELFGKYALFTNGRIDRSTVSREIATGSMQASMPMKPRPARRIPERIFKGLLPTAMPEKLIW